jgi:hypothetical protein
VPAHAGHSRSFETVFFILAPAQKKSPGERIIMRTRLPKILSSRGGASRA